MKVFFLKTPDGFPLNVHIFEPEKSNGKLLLINSATGVKQQVYFGFAEFMSQNGFTVITYDYRGVGKSKPNKMRGFKASMRVWGIHDYKTITAFIRKNYSNYQKFCVGHSVGALILGMNEDSKIFEKFIFIATQDAYITHLPQKIKPAALLGFGIVLPLTTAFMGYFPANWFGLGESLPKGSALDWRTLILHKKSITRLYEKIPKDSSKTMKQKTLVLYAEDDPWVTVRGMESLMNKCYPNLQTKYREIKVAESAKEEIGHINFFRKYNKNLWNIVLNELYWHD